MWLPSGTSRPGAGKKEEIQAVTLETSSGKVALERASGFADRRWSVAMTPSTRLSIASGTKGFTALVVMSLVESGELTLDTPARRTRTPPEYAGSF